MVRQLPYIAIAATFMGIGVAGEPLMPQRAILAAMAVVAITYAFRPVPTPLVAFLYGVFATYAVAYVQHTEADVQSAVAALAVGGFSAATVEKPRIWQTLALAGALIGTATFFIG